MGKRKEIVVIGAGPGGLASAMMLSAQGYKVTVFENKPYIGGRTSAFSLGDYTFDWANLFSMPHILEELFEASARKLEDYVTMKEIDPMYTVAFDDFQMQATRDEQKMKETVESHFPGYGREYERFMKDSRKKLNSLFPILQAKHDSIFDYLRLKSLKALPSLDVGKSLYDVLSNYFHDDRLLLSFTFQSKYLGMSPWKCPGAFSFLSFMEYEYGIYHPIGGLNKLTEALGKVVVENGGEIHLNTGVSKLILEGKEVRGVELESGDKIVADEVVMNADFAYGISRMVGDQHRKKYTNVKLEEKDYSCSTFMIYAGVDREVPMDHHTILFAEDYRRNVEEITETFSLSDDPSIYVQNAAVTDPTLAPKGKSPLYILAPVPNNGSNIDWDKEKEGFRDLVWSQLEKKTGISDLRNSIEEEKIITPHDWEREKYIFKGATFNLAHNLNQMMYLRPHNQWKELNGLYLVGGGTHPGSGLPTIFESARITSNLIMAKHNKKERPIHEEIDHGRMLHQQEDRMTVFK
ncbi:MAG: phytoene desaturase [Bacillus sp. (in: Bacteria)]|nr:phytoene desaturase [Bacillus sp. (in: firmicutes)]